MAKQGRLTLSDIKDKIPPGFIKEVPFRTRSGVTFTFSKYEVSISKLQTNLASQCYFIDIRWGKADDQIIYGIPIKSGVNLLEQYPMCPLPNLYAFDSKNIGADIMDYGSMVMYTIDWSVM